MFKELGAQETKSAHLPACLPSDFRFRLQEVPFSHGLVHNYIASSLSNSSFSPLNNRFVKSYLDVISQQLNNNYTAKQKGISSVTFKHVRLSLVPSNRNTSTRLR